MIILLRTVYVSGLWTWDEVDHFGRVHALDYAGVLRGARAPLRGVRARAPIEQRVTETEDPMNDTQRAARYVLNHFPRAIPNGHLVDELRDHFYAVRRDERRQLREREGKPNPLHELTDLLAEAGLVPFLHAPGCAMWEGKGACDRGCKAPEVRA